MPEGAEVLPTLDVDWSVCDVWSVLARDVFTVVGLAVA